MANKREVENFIKEKLKEKTVTLNIGEAQEQIELSAKKALAKNEKLLAENKNAIDIVKKIVVDLMNTIANDLFEKQVSEIIDSQEFLNKFSCESSIEEALESNVIDDKLRNLLKRLKAMGVKIEVKKINLE